MTNKSMQRVRSAVTNSWRRGIETIYWEGQENYQELECIMDVGKQNLDTTQTLSVSVCL